MTAPAMKVLPSSKRDELIERLNNEYALILLGERPAILREGSGADGRPEFRMLSVSGFHEWLRPVVIWESDGHGNTRKVQGSKVWIDSDKRRQYQGIVFDPSNEAPDDYYNLWKGFAVEASPVGSCSRFLEHVGNNVCGGDEKLFAWVMGFFAQMFQEPTNKLGTSLVLRGAQGTGKTIVGRIIGSLLGQHYALVADSRYIVGRFNAHLANCLLLQLDEATWGGDHAAAGKLKDLITGEYQYIEYKGKEPVRVPNHVRLLVTGNNNWLVPAGLEERRFAVLDVGDDKRQDHKYFQAIDDEMRNGGREALLHYLLNYDLTDIPLRTIPHTAALAEQQVASMDPLQQWWLDILHRGSLPGDLTGSGEVNCHALYDDYLNRMTRIGINRRSGETAFGIALRRLVPGLERHRKSFITVSGQGRTYVYQMPPLAICRAEFKRLVGEPELDQNDTTDWQKAEPKP